MSKLDKSLQRSAELRAAIIAVLTSAPTPLPAREIFGAPEVQRLGRQRQTFDTMIWSMSKSGKLERSGTAGSYLYTVKRGREVVVVQPTVRVKQTPGGQPTVKIDLDRKNGRVRIEVIGNLILDFGTGETK